MTYIDATRISGPIAPAFSVVMLVTMLENKRQGSATFIDICEAPLLAEMGNKPFLSVMKPKVMVKNLVRI